MGGTLEEEVRRILDLQDGHQHPVNRPMVPMRYRKMVPQIFRIALWVNAFLLWTSLYMIGRLIGLTEGIWFEMLWAIFIGVPSWVLAAIVTNELASHYRVLDSLKRALREEERARRAR